MRIETSLMIMPSDYRGQFIHAAIATSGKCVLLPAMCCNTGSTKAESSKNSCAACARAGKANDAKKHPEVRQERKENAEHFTQAPSKVRTSVQYNEMDLSC